MYKQKLEVPLKESQRDWLCRLGMETLINKKYGPNFKMFWARLVENRTPIFFGAFVISFTAFLITASIKNDANSQIKEQAEEITKLTLEKQKLQQAFNVMTYREVHGLTGKPFHVDRAPQKIVLDVSMGAGRVKKITSNE